MTHLDDDALVLLHYGDGDPLAAEHVRGCAECRERLSGLADLLAAVVAEPAPERPADYGATVWSRIEPRLQSDPGPLLVFRALGVMPWRRVAGLATLAASLVLAFLLGRQFPGPSAKALTPEVRERILLVAIGDHLERSQMVLVELRHRSRGRSPRRLGRTGLGQRPRFHQPAHPPDRGALGGAGPGRSARRAGTGAGRSGGRPGAPDPRRSRRVAAPHRVAWAPVQDPRGRVASPRAREGPAAFGRARFMRRRMES